LIHKNELEMARNRNETFDYDVSSAKITRQHWRY